MNNDSSHFSFDEPSGGFPTIGNTPANSQASQPDFSFSDSIKQKVIWGTTININETKELFKNLIGKYYSSKITKIYETEINIFEFDCNLIKGTKIFEQFFLYPEEIIEILEKCVEEVLIEKYPQILERYENEISKMRIYIQPINIGKAISIRNMEPSDIGKLIKISGLILRTSKCIPEINKAYFKCCVCDHHELVECVKNVINEPVECLCGAKFSYQIENNKSLFSDKQIIKLQELPELIPAGMTPISVTVVAEAILIDCVKPGDRVSLIGVFKASPVKVNSISRKIRSSFRTYLTLFAMEKIEFFGTENEAEILNEKEEDLLIEDDEDALNAPSLRTLLHQQGLTVAEPKLFDILSSFIAPSVFGMEDTKKAILLQLLGGVRKQHENTSFRGDIHVLLAGDPGVAKSQLLSFVNSISPRGVYTSGKGSSSVGLTAAVVRDIDTGEFVLEPGAVVLSNGGICCIDEFDKMSDTTRGVLHESMEQQTISIAKAGIVTSLPAESSILASCNPIESKWNIRKSIIENINLPPALLSRFDIVNVLIDKADALTDRKVAEHITSLFVGNKELVALTEELKEDNSVKYYFNKIEDDMKITILKRLIKEAKDLKPVISKEAAYIMQKSYVELRNLNSGKTVTATTRQLESIIRLSEAHAKCRLSNIVLPGDVIEAVRLIKASMLLYAIDPETGRIDMDLILTGKSSSKRDAIKRAKELIISKLNKRIEIEELINKHVESGLLKDIVKEALAELESEGLISNEGGIVEKTEE
ncbi:DNA replication licensing factor MCM4 [Cucumispora dikerogammari]|nr:DNA replication licensing factor MCM4 [Cucumispora dikerogammari]